LEVYLKHLSNSYKISCIAKILGLAEFTLILNQSLDLWLDGYEIGIPDAKSEYLLPMEAVIATLVWILILLKSNKAHLTKSCEEAWKEFGNLTKGYSADSLLDLILRS